MLNNDHVYMIENAAKVPFKFCFGAPSASRQLPSKRPGRKSTPRQWPNCSPCPKSDTSPRSWISRGSLRKTNCRFQKFDMPSRPENRSTDMPPVCVDPNVKKYAEAGISTDHECFTREEALDKLQAGMKILIREGSAAKNFDALISLLDEFPDEIMFCSDDKHPNDLVAGHLDQLAQRAVAFGCDPMNVLRACSLNVIRHYDLAIGLLQENDPADFAVVNNLSEFHVLETYIDGQKVAENRKSSIGQVEEIAINHFHGNPVSENALEIDAENNRSMSLK